MTKIPDYTENEIYKIIELGYKPILVHPERYIEIQEDPNKVIDFIKMGCIIQVNSTSITGLSGENVQKTAKILLENNMAHLIASDSHSDRRRRPVLTSAYDIMNTWIGENALKKITKLNPQLIIENKEINIEEPINFVKKKKLISFKRLFSSVD